MAAGVARERRAEQHRPIGELAPKVAPDVVGEHAVGLIGDLGFTRPEEAEILEDLITAAHNDAKSRLDALLQQEMSKLTGGIKLPPGFKLPF